MLSDVVNEGDVSLPTGTMKAQVTGDDFPDEGQSHTSNLYLFYTITQPR